MFSKKSRTLFFRSIQFRQGIIFTLTITVFSFILYFWIVYSIYQEQVKEELAFLNHKLISYYAYYQTQWIDAFINHIQRDMDQDNQDYFIRLVSSEGHQIFFNSPREWRDFDYSPLFEPGGIQGEYETLSGPQKDFLLVATQLEFFDGVILQGGISTETREELFSLYRNSYGRIFPLVMLFSFLVGTLTTSRALIPIKELNLEIAHITETADISRRIKHSGSGDQLDYLVQQFNSLLDKVEGLIDEQKSTMDAAAHDLRTPLTRLAGRAEVALRNENLDQEEVEDILTQTILDSQQILKIFTILMSISESEKRLVEEEEIFNLHEVLENISEMYSLIAEERNIKIHLDLAPLQRAYRGSKIRISQALSNLIDNAVKYSKDGEDVMIRMTGGRGGISIEVENHGEPIAPDERSKIWNRFYRGDKSRTTEGLGLGLSLVQAVIHAHRGSIDVESDSFGLTRFTVNLPYLIF